MKKTTFAILLSAAFATPAFAEGFFIGGDIGQVNYSNNGGTTPPSPKTLRAGGGYHFSPNIAVEAGYSVIGDSTIKYFGAGWSSSETLKASSLQIAAVGTFSISDKFDLIGKLGVARTKLNYIYSGTNLTPSSGIGRATKSNLLIGLGAQFNINKHFGIRAMYEDFGKTKLKASFNDGGSAVAEFGLKVISIGGVYNF